MIRKTGRHIPEIRLRRAYDAPGDDDGYRVLVDRFWPRGRSREALRLSAWARELAPQPELIKWFGHKPERWDVFRQRYRKKLDEPEQEQQLSELLRAAGDGVLTLVYAARSETQNQAVVIRDALVDAANRTSI
jgi:uncharacterized protein YeaO (DUF488 family)